MGKPEEERGKEEQGFRDVQRNDGAEILQVGDYMVQLSFQEETEETIEDRILVLARRLSQILIEENI